MQCRSISESRYYLTKISRHRRVVHRQFPLTSSPRSLSYHTLHVLGNKGWIPPPPPHTHTHTHILSHLIQTVSKHIVTVQRGRTRNGRRHWFWPVYVSRVYTWIGCCLYAHCHTWLKTRRLQPILIETIVMHTCRPVGTELAQYPQYTYRLAYNEIGSHSFRTVYSDWIGSNQEWIGSNRTNRTGSGHIRYSESDRIRRDAIISYQI